MPEEKEPEFYLAVVGAIITQDKEGKPLKDPYVVTTSRGVKGTITFSLRLWKEDFELSTGDEVYLGGVHRRRIRINSEWDYGWRAGSVKPVSPRQESQKQMSDVPVTSESAL